MEDLKQIQEFFSKPLNEASGNIDIEDFAKVVKAVEQTGHPVTVLLTPMFGKNEIELVIGLDAPDPIGDSMFDVMNDLGYKRGDFSIVGDTSTLSRREYAQIRRVNGGHKDYGRYFEESVNENALGFNDSRLSSDQHRDLDYAVRGDNAYTFGNDPYADDQLRYKYAVKMGFLNEAEYTDYSNKELAAYCKNNPTDKKAAKELHKRSQALKNLSRTDVNEGAVEIMDAFNDVMDLVKKHSRNLNDDDSYALALKLKAWFNKNILDEAKIEVDDKTEFKLDLKHLLDKHVVEQGYSLTKEHETDPNLELKVGDYQTQHFHMCPGAKSLYQDIENKVEDMGLAIRSAKLQDALFAMEESALENGANEADVFAAETIADQIMAMAAMMGLDKEHSYIQGHVDKIKGALDKEQVAESSSSEERRIAKRAIRSIAKYRGVSDDEARNDLIRAANELGDLKENMLSLDDEAKAYYLEKLKKGEIDTLPEDPKEAFLNQMTKDQMDHDAETLRRERGLEESAAYIAETIKLGLMLNEELCDKGKRYIKARQAAGEKSSAYLSGRAVRVCKGQIEWPKKGKKKK